MDPPDQGREREQGGAPLTADGNAGVGPVSCASAGSCAAGGWWAGRPDSKVESRAFVVSERGGRWGRAIEVPGLAALNADGNAAVSAASCASAGDCAAGGWYADRADSLYHVQAFVAVERDGRWGTAIEVPGSAALNRGGSAAVSSVSCPSAGNCAAGGSYADTSNDLRAFVVSERAGRWRTATAVKVPGSAPGSTDSAVSSLSCPSSGNCAAGGWYTDTSGYLHAFVVRERNGRWGTAIEVPGSETNAFGYAAVVSVSCPSAGDCAAGGWHTDVAGHRQAIVADERDGRWGTAIEVRGLAALNAGGRAQVVSLSCSSAGNCAAGGFYTAVAGHPRAFVVSERNGRWGNAIEVPGL